jgi:hypothetical protein
MAGAYIAWFSLICPATVAGKEFATGRSAEGMQLQLARMARSLPGPNYLGIGHAVSDIRPELVDDLCANLRRAARFKSWAIEREHNMPTPPPSFGDEPGVVLRWRWRGGDGGQVEVLLPGRIGPIAGTDTGTMLGLGTDIATAIGPILTTASKAATLWGSGNAHEGARWTARRFIAREEGRGTAGAWLEEHLALLPGVCYVAYFTNGRERKIVLVHLEGGVPFEIPSGHLLDLAPDGGGPYVITA